MQASIFPGPPGKVLLLGEDVESHDTGHLAAAGTALGPANIFGSKPNSFLRVSTLNGDLRGSPLANHLFQTFGDSDNLYLQLEIKTSLYRIPENLAPLGSNCASSAK